MGEDTALERFISRWRANEGGAERANYVLFLTELCSLLDLPQPEPADASHTRNDYVFERAVTFKDEAGKAGHGRIDLYKRGAFVLEAKQSREPGGKKEVTLPAEQTTLPGFAATQIRGRRSAQRGWDVLMRNAREQAEQYARALPTEHGWPPFIIVADVGHAFEIFADFSGQGKNYRQFPDRSGYRIYLDDLREPDIRKRLRAMWLDPHSLDPAKHAAAVTRDIAKRLASVSKLLEARGYAAEPVAHFLMRCLFTMFAEDTGLLESGSFTEVLADARANPESFAPLLEDLWRSMDTGGFSPVLRKTIRKFNGGLFAERTAIPLHEEEIGELYEAAKHVWTEVEPAIFGTLLEQALDPVERKRLGAHYTPRAYVERLVIATIIEPLQREWETEVLGTVERERTADPQGAIRAVHDFHEKLAATRVLDPACGTGNFLYVALELMKRLEGDVLEVLADLGGQEALGLETATVHPRNFLGLELNPRAAAIAELVLWLGYLQWQMRNGGQIADPVLERLSNITAMDAVLKHDPARMRDDGTLDEFPNPRRPDWPQADYIVGNPPFIGKGAMMRTALGDHYVEALRRAHPKVDEATDFVMYWWDVAATILQQHGSRLKRFGFVTTNTITGSLNRRVLQNHMKGKQRVSIVFAIPDHPWTKATKDAASVRIAMTAAELGDLAGQRLDVIFESGLDTDSPIIELRACEGTVNADLSLGADAGSAFSLLSNIGLASTGMMLAGAGFKVSPAEAVHFREIDGEAAAAVLRPYAGGGELVQRMNGTYVIDLFGQTSEWARRNVPALYTRLLQQVKPARDLNRRDYRREKWWWFGENNPNMRRSLEGLSVYIGTTETSKHRLFQFLPGSLVPDHMVIAISLDDPFTLGVLSSRTHVVWSLTTGGTLEDRPRYNKSRCFDPFPFPDAIPEQRAIIGDLAEELDATRKEVLVEHSDLTLTGLYNLREKLRQHGPFTAAEQDHRRRGRVDIIAELHDRIDAAVADAYGWQRDLSDEAIVTRLVALNAERHAEEKAGTVRWLRPDYQIPRAGVAVLAPKAQPEQIEAMLPAAATKKPAFPRDAIGQTAAVLADLRGGAALTSAEIARRYAQGLKVEPRISATLAALVRLGHVADEGYRYTLRRVA